MKGTKTGRGDGVWRLRVFVGYTENGTPRQISQTFRGSEKDANTALAALVTTTTLGTAPISGTTTLRQYLEDVWLPHIEATRESSTVRGYRSKVARIVAILGRHRLVRLSTADVDRAYGRWLQEGLSPSSVHHIHRVLASALHQAAKWNYVNVLATDRATPPSKRRTIPKVPTPQVIRQLIAETEGKQPVLAATIALAASTGMRRGELLGLYWDDVDLDAEVIMVRRSLKQAAAGRAWTAGEVKSHAERVVNLSSWRQVSTSAPSPAATDTRIPRSPCGPTATPFPGGIAGPPKSWEPCSPDDPAG